MASVQDLIEGLEQTGTGEPQLKWFADYAEKYPKASAEEAIDAARNRMKITREEFLRETCIADVTLAKADHIAAGKPLSDLMGKPPPDSKGEELKKLGVAIAEAITNKMREEGEKRIIPVTAASVAKKKD